MHEKIRKEKSQRFKLLYIFIIIIIIIVNEVEKWSFFHYWMEHSIVVQKNYQKFRKKISFSLHTFKHIFYFANLYLFFKFKIDVTLSWRHSLAPIFKNSNTSFCTRWKKVIFFQNDLSKFICTVHKRCYFF